VTPVSDDRGTPRADTPRDGDSRQSDGTRRAPAQTDRMARGERAQRQPGQGVDRQSGRRDGGATGRGGSQSQGESVDTGATTAGVLPDGPGVALLVLVTAGVVALGAALGYSVTLLGVLCATGVLGAAGVRAATRSGRTGTGVALLWVAAFVFAVTATLLMGESTGDAASLAAGLVVASGALLAPFAVLGSTVRLYGQGAGRRVVRRYLVGAVLLAGAALPLFLADQILSLGDGLLPPALAGSLASGSLARQVVVAIGVYGVGLFVGVRVARAFPAAVFVDSGEFDRVARVRATVERWYRYGLRAVWLYALLAMVLALFAAGTTTGWELTRAFLRVTAWPPAVVLVGTVTAGLAAVLGVVWLLRSVGGLSRASVVSVFLPVVTVAGLAVLVSTVFAEQTGSVADRFVRPSTVESFLVGVSVWEFTALTAGLFLASAVVFGVPTLVAGQRLGDESLAGVASAVLAVVVVVVVAVLAGRGLVVVAGVALATVVWEFGEFTTVASGELAAPSAGLSEGFGRLASVHAVATLAVAGGATLLAGLIYGVATGSALSTTVGTVVVIVTGIGIAALTLLLSG
jgi:hypothetical protein